jgi:hypothetical protein
MKCEWSAGEASGFGFQDFETGGHSNLRGVCVEQRVACHKQCRGSVWRSQDDQRSNRVAWRGFGTRPAQ